MDDFSRRAFLILCGKLSFMSILIGKLYHLQIIKSSQYKILAENNSIKALIIQASRGLIYDKNDKILADNIDNYKLIIDKKSKNIEYIIDIIIKKLNINIVDLDYNKYKNYIVIKDNLSWNDLVKVETELFEIENLLVQYYSKRYYPYKSSYSHILGYVNNENMKSNNLNQQDIQIGKFGIEKSFNNNLSGRSGIKKLEVNAYGKIVRELEEKQAIKGEDIKLSVDIDIQEFVENRIRNIIASTVVIDIENGNILSMASSPNFDPNIFTKSIDRKMWNDISNDKSLPLLNRSIANQYPPGSIFKLIVAITALEENINPNMIHYCNGHMIIGNRRFNCWRENGHGALNLTQAIIHSCNCYFYNLSMMINIDKFVTIANKLGLGRKTNIEMNGELKGVIPNKKWKLQNVKENWQIGDSLNTSIGQGFVLATPLQLAVMTARIASGNMINPSLLFNNHRKFEKINIKDNNLNVIRNAMDNVVNQIGATAYNNRIDIKEKKMAGKTGTSQISSKKNYKEDLSKESTLLERRNHGIFVCYAPVHQPKYACCVVVEHGRSGSAVAPIARDIMIKVQN